MKSKARRRMAIILGCGWIGVLANLWFGLELAPLAGLVLGLVVVAFGDI